jgi:hypothetical protein
MKLDDLPKKNIYPVPDRYFDQLPGRVMARVREKESANNPVTMLTFWRQPLLRGALAGLALVLSCIFIYTFSFDPPQSTAPSDVLRSEVTEKEALEYLIASGQLEAQDLTGLPLSNEDLSHEFIQVSQEELLQAVENEDLGDIYNLLK